MWTKFTLRCVLCDHYATRSIDTQLAHDFVDEVEACDIECASDYPDCCDARSYGIGTMRIIQQIPLARVAGVDLHPMTQEHFSWITSGASQVEDIPF